MKVSFTLIDSPTGNVEIKTDPTFQQLLNMAKAGDATFAVKYAICAMSAMVNFSDRIAEETRSQLIVPEKGTPFKLEIQ